MELSSGVAQTRKKLLTERFETNVGYLEHLARYQFSSKLVKDKIVLDLGCGIGDGTRILAVQAKKVIGVEIDKARLLSADGYFKDDNMFYMSSSGCALSFKSGAFDVVNSLEVIEHLCDQDSFVFEIRRVLNDHGIAIISTPNRELIKIEGAMDNPEHLRELSYQEFDKLLKKYFSKVELFGERRGKGVTGLSGGLHHIIRAIDIFGIRKMFPQDYRKKVSDGIAKNTGAKRDADLVTSDIVISRHNLGLARNVIAVCRK